MIKDNRFEKLIFLDFNFNSKGIYYWLGAIDLYRKNINISMINLYKILAIRYNKTPHQIERTLRTASETAKNKIKEVYNYNGKLNNKSILVLLANSL